MKTRKKRERRRALGMPKLRFERFSHGPDTLEFKVSVDLEHLSPVSIALVERSSYDILFISIALILAIYISMYVAMPFLLAGIVLMSFRCHYGTVKSESIIAIEEIGCQLTTLYFNGTKSSKFIEKAKIRSVLMNEGVTLCRVVFYVAFLLKNESKITLAFENLRPNLRVLTKVIGGVCSVMFGESDECSVSLKKPSSPTSSSRRRSPTSSSRRRKMRKSTSTTKTFDGNVRRRVFKDEDE